MNEVAVRFHVVENGVISYSTIIAINQEDNFESLKKEIGLENSRKYCFCDISNGVAEVKKTKVLILASISEVYVFEDFDNAQSYADDFKSEIGSISRKKRKRNETLQKQSDIEESNDRYTKKRNTDTSSIFSKLKCWWNN